jgi:murein DD-endopeptidase MepM/ murein hydrolase activator NlpD
MQAGRRFAVAVSVALAGSAIAGSAASAGGGGIGAPGPGDPAPAEEGQPGTGGGIAPGFGPSRYGFPLDVPYTYGDGFGAGRGHEGQDLFAECGSPILAVRAGRIQRADFHARAGNYVVVDGRGTGVDTVYSHMLRRAAVRRGARVAAGAVIGQVGSSGNSSGCHLHFEIWTAPGWYEGGNPMPSVGRLLRAWDAGS